MNNLSVLVYGLYLIAALLCIVLGVYFLYVNINTNLNKLAFLFCSSLSCWCLGAALSLTASSYENSMLWIRFSAIGVSTFFGFLLHYVIILTNQEQFLKKRWAKYILYIPSVISIYILAISEFWTAQLYVLEKFPLGWIVSIDNSIYTLFINLYNIGYMLIGIYLIYQWKRKSEGLKKKRQADFILLSYVVMLIVSIIAKTQDIFSAGHYFREAAPLILVLPLFGIYYSIHNYDLMKVNSDLDEIAFIEQFRTKISRYLAEAFTIGGVMYMTSQYLSHNQMEFFKVIGFAFVLVLFGFGIYVVHLFIKKKELKVILYSVLLSLAIPVITLHFAEDAAITVWAFPFIVVIATLLFNNSTILTMVSTSMVLTQLYMWIFVSYKEVSVESSDYFARIGLMVLGIALIHYINKIYLLRLSQLSEKIQEQDLLFLISSHVIQVNNENMKDKMNEVLALLCEYVQADRAHIYFRESEDIAENSAYYSWCNEDSKLERNILQDISIVRFPWLKKQINEKGAVLIANVNKLPNEAEKEKIFLLNQKVQSMMIVPLISQEEKIGFLRIDYVANRKTFDDAFTKILITIGNILGEAHIKTCSEKKMEQMAYYDQLTNIPNRQMFSKCINQVIENSNQNGELFGIIFLDLDSFKIVNDTLGHHYGDKILIMIADRLAKCIRKTDTVCRFGGDEFLIMLNDVTCKADIETVAAKIIKQLEKPLYIEEQEFNITASVGISIFPIDGVDNDTLIKNADIAMYKAKSSGRNQFVFCSPEMKQEIEQSLILTNNLYHAQERSELDIVYQPQIDIITGQIIAVEALARWYHPELGMVSPGIFIPIAEHTSLINSIGEWILRKACEQNKYWQDKGLKPVRMAVNVSVNQLLNSNFSNKVMSILEETGLEPKYLELEITENIAIQESEYIISVLTRLKKSGISIAIDDFGIEYSSLNRIKLLPIDRLKIDMHFIKGILTCDKDKVIVDVIIKLAKDLELKVIAEGVETKEQLEYLIEKKCDEVQGYYFYKPLPKSEFEAVLTKITNNMQ